MPSTLITVDLSPASLEFEASKLLREVFKDRGLAVRHNGTSSTHAPAGRPDIELFNDDVHINVETTKLIRVAQANQEATPVAAHLDDVAQANPGKAAFALFVSPTTFERTVDLFHHYNHTYAGRDDRKIAFMDFSTFNILMDWLVGPNGTAFRVVDLCNMLRDCARLQDDHSVLAYINDTHIHISEIDDEVQRIRREKLGEKYSRLDSVFKGIHDDLRSVCGLGPAEAFHELSKLVFLKMYEEQAVLRESEAGRVTENRFTTKYIQEERRRRRGGARMVHPITRVFEEVRQEFRGEKLFDPDESIAIQPDKDEGNYIDDIVGQVEEYSFIDPDVPLTDIKGMIYEQFLGLSLKNTDLGQYFTPEPIIQFMVAVAGLTPDDRVLDPACGTGRFLVQSMNDMLAKASDAETRARIKAEQLVGNEKSPYVSKIGKMNMFVHGDGRANIYERDSFEYFPNDEEKFDVILTNPPLGDINFRKLFGDYAANPAWYDSMEVIEKTTRLLKKTGVARTTVTRNEMKGGALFLNKYAHFVRDGARVLTVMDEAVLNTDEYVHVREFIRKHFYIQAIFSLTEDAFKHASKTATKTSILVLEKKIPAAATQRTPVFFGHAFQVGVNPKGKPCPNDLMDAARPRDLFRAYGDFVRAVADNRAHNRGEFRQEDFEFTPGALDTAANESFSAFSYFVVPFDRLEERLEYKWYDPTYLPIEQKIEGRQTVRFADLVDPNRTAYGLTETGLEDGDIPFINIENLVPDTSIDLRGVRYVLRSNRKIRPQHYTEKDDILISRSRLPGIAAVVTHATQGMTYGSYIIRFHLNDEQGAQFLPEYVALFINSIFGQAQVHRLKSGSNGYNINSAQLGSIRILELGIQAQKELVDNAQQQRKAAARLGAILRRFQDVSETSLIRSCLGLEAREDFEQLVEDVASRLKPVHASLDEFDSEGQELADLREARKHFEIRPTFYAKLPTDG